MVPGGRLTIQHNPGQIVLAGRQAVCGDLGWGRGLEEARWWRAALPSCYWTRGPSLSLTFFSQPGPSDSHPSGMAQKLPPPGSPPWFPNTIAPPEPQSRLLVSGALSHSQDASVKGTLGQPSFPLSSQASVPSVRSPAGVHIPRYCLNEQLQIFTLMVLKLCRASQLSGPLTGRAG